jgi:glutaryl-CoA dehydrogenase
MLDSARYGIAWELLVLLWIVMTLHFVMLKNEFFDKPIAGTQLQQKKLAEMTEITKHNY